MSLASGPLQEQSPPETPDAAVRIERIAAGGDGVGRLADGRTVFVPRTAPGDLIELTGVRKHARFARARIGRLLEPGPGRTEPACPHYLQDDCGGCRLQHLAPATQLDQKRAIVEDALRRIGKLDVTVPPVVAGDEWWGYRNRITLTVGPGRRFAGYHPLERPTHVFPLERCLIAAPALQDLWRALQPALGLLPPDAEQLMLRLDRSGGLHVLVKARGDQAWSGAERLAERLGGAVTIWWQPERGAPRVVAGDREVLPATVFQQVYASLGDRIRTFALDLLGDLTSVHVWDLYAGIGETTDLLLARGATVESVELDRRAVSWAEGRDAGKPTGAVRHIGRVEAVIDRLKPAGAVIANPPRTGMDARVTGILLERRPPRIVYVSCDPATLARDLARLGIATGVYRLAMVQPFDLFPQTAHVETVVLLEVR
jgi:23S rRNA (uracil1939-C5)-methyltransferase